MNPSLVYPKQFFHKRKIFQYGEHIQFKTESLILNNHFVRNVAFKIKFQFLDKSKIINSFNIRKLVRKKLISYRIKQKSSVPFRIGLYKTSKCLVLGLIERIRVVQYNSEYVFQQQVSKYFKQRHFHLVSQCKKIIQHRTSHAALPS
jgi:hypothetical protein